MNYVDNSIEKYCPSPTIKQWILSLLLLLSMPFLSAQNANHQQIIPIDSEIYQVIKTLYISQGLGLPSTAGPWSEDELLSMLDRLDPARLKLAELKAYNFAEKELARKKSVFQVNGAVSIELMWHTDNENFLTQDRYVQVWNKTKPFILLNFESWISPYLYGFGQLSLGNSIFNKTIPEHNKELFNSTERVSSLLFGETSFATNFLDFVDIANIDTSIPYRAFIAAGTSGWNIQVGRERLSWGAGESGNFMIGDHVQYHNNVRATAYKDFFKYTFNVSSFLNPAEYYKRTDKTGSGSAYNPVLEQSDLYQGVRLFIAHRFEWRIINRINLAISESILYQDDNGNMSLEIFNPLMLLHDIYRVNSSNSLLTVEIDYSPIPMLNLYGQVAIDEFKTFNEKSTEDDQRAPPSRLGFMLGTKTAFPLGGGMFTASAEGVLTSPYLYLRGERGQKQVVYGISYVIANRYHNNNYYAVEEFLGYRWGGDAMVLHLKADYRVAGKWNLGAALMIMQHGTHDMWTYSNEVFSAESSNAPHDYATPTTTHDLPNTVDPTAQSTRDAAYLMTTVSVFG